MHFRSRHEALTRALIQGLTLLIFAIAALGAPPAAEASAYRWKDVNGNWTDKNNWELIDGSGDYPNAPGDEVFFTRLYSERRTVTIPVGVTVTAGKIVYSDKNIVIAGAGRLRIDNGFQVPQIIRLGSPPPEGGDAFTAAVELRGSPEIIIADNNVVMGFSGTISNSGCACGLTLKTGGRLYLRGTNSYLGTTSVEKGQLILDFADDITKIAGNLEIGSGYAGDVVAEVLVTKRNQISDTSRVLVKGQGLLTVDAAEAVGDTIVTDGFITIRNDAGSFAPASLTMAGGTIDSRANGKLLLRGNLTATSSAKSPASIVRSSGAGVVDMGATGYIFAINDGPSNAHDLTIDLPIVGSGNAGIAKTGTGTLRLTASNTYPGSTQVREGRLWLEPAAGGPGVLNTVTIGAGAGPAIVEVRKPNGIKDTAPVIVGANGSLWINTTVAEVIGSLTVTRGGLVAVGNNIAFVRLVTGQLSMEGGRVQMFYDENILEVNGPFNAASSGQETAEIIGGNLALAGTRTLEVSSGSGPPSLRITSKITGGPTAGLRTNSAGMVAVSGANPFGGATEVNTGTLLINGSQPASPVNVLSGKLGGTGKTGPITHTSGSRATIAPGDNPGKTVGRLQSGSIVFSVRTDFPVELNAEGSSASDQLAVTGTVNLGGANLEIKPAASLPRDGSWTIIDNDGSDPVIGTFDEVPEGKRIGMSGHEYRLTYRGGDGNDVVIEAQPPPTYYLAEGATGEFFDDDVLIANPNGVDAPVTITFLREGGATVVVERVIPKRSRVTIHVDEIEGLEDTSASVKIASTNHLELVVERTMFWDASYYGGHTANAVAQPVKQWTFAEGFQGFFDTYILIANANATKAVATLTFLRENDTPVVKMVEVAPFARKTIYAGEFDELKGRAFGIVIDATEPVVAERAMYFVTVPDKLWAGGHVNTGIVAPSRSWFHAEGATGSYFSTFILLSNPQATEAKIDVRFLLPDGTVITRKKTLASQQRVTINPAAEGDARLENTAVSTIVQSDVPIVSERSMYWEGDAKPFGEGHNSSGVTEPGLRWGLAEGRVGGDRKFDSYILLANPSTTKAEVRVTFLRENGAPIVKTYEVPATSRFNIDVKVEVPELQDASFGADIEVLNDVPIAVERSMYWNGSGAFWSGGTNALATPLRPAA